MRLRLLSVLICLGSALVAVPPGASAAPLPTMSGRVLNLDGSPAVGVIVRPNRTTDLVGVSGTDGEFAFQVEAYAQDMAMSRGSTSLPGTFSRVSHMIDATQSRRFSDSYLPDLHEGHIVVQDEQGDPVVGAVVSGAAYWWRDQDFSNVYEDFNPHRFDAFGLGYPDRATDATGRVAAALPDIREPWGEGMKVDFTAGDGIRHQADLSEASWKGPDLVLTLSDVDVPAAPPAPPTNVQAVRGDGSATVTWTAPPATRLPLQGFTVTSTPGGVAVAVEADQTSALVPGLVNGTTYRFTVRARNAEGESPSSATSSPVTPAGPPAAPTRVAATAGDGSATVSWTAAPPNGSPVLKYSIETIPETTVTVGGPQARSARVTGLSNGVEYRFVVVATNEIGDSQRSEASDVVIPSQMRVPTRPSGLRARVTRGKVVLSWDALQPPDPPVDSYHVWVDGIEVRTLTGPARRTRLTALARGKHKISLGAVNPAGRSALAKVRVRVK